MFDPSYEFQLANTTSVIPHVMYMRSKVMDTYIGQKLQFMTNDRQTDKNTSRNLVHASN